MAGNTKRQQTRDLETQVNTRQDRNIFLTDGGTWTWSTSTGTLTWDATIYLRRGGINAHTISAGSVVGLSSQGHIAYIDLDRVAGGTLTVQGGSAPGPLLFAADVLNSTDSRFVVGVRGADGKLYLRDGTIFSDGDSKTLGTLNSVTDRDVQTSTGVLTYTTFNFNIGSNQLQVYVGGILQQLGVDYGESSPNIVDFLVGRQPAAGEIITFLNVVGGQGPSGGTGTLQDAVDASAPVVDTSASGPIELYSPTGLNQVLAWGDTIGVFSGTLRKDGSINLIGDLADGPGGRAGLILRGGDLTTSWTLIPEDSASGDLLLGHELGTLTVSEGIRLKSDGSGIEFGQYTGGSYPSGSWSGDGPIRWTVIQGTLDAAGPSGQHEISTGLSTMVSALFMIYDSNQSINLMSEYGAGTFSNKSHAVMIDNVAQQIEIWATPTTEDISTRTHIIGEAYTIIIFHQG